LTFLSRFQGRREEDLKHKNEQGSVAIKEPKNKGFKSRVKIWPKWFRNVLLLIILGSLILVGALSYAVTFMTRPNQLKLGELLLQGGQIEMLYENNLLLYLDLTNRNSEEDLNYWELYEPQLWEEILRKFTTKSSAEEYLDQTTYKVRSLEDTFTSINQTYDYFAKDMKTGEYLTNSGEARGLLSNQYLFYLTFFYDENGNVSLGETVKGEDRADIMRTAADVLRKGYLSSDIDIYQMITENDNVYIQGDNATNNQIMTTTPHIYQCAITYGITEETWSSMREERLQNSIFDYHILYFLRSTFLLLTLGMLVFAFLTRKKLQTENYLRMKQLTAPYAEILIILVFVIYIEMSQIAYFIVHANRGLRNSVSIFIECYAESVFCAVVILLGAWYVGTCAATIKEMKVLPYIRQKSALIKFFHWMGRKARKTYQSFQHIDLTQNSKKTILKLIWVNASILLVISALWFGGIVLIVIYSFIVYFIMKKYAGDIQKKYSILLDAINEIAQGNLHVTIKEDIGIFEPFKPQIERIQQGFRSAVEEEMKSQRMKTELITNVSHDLKTPLTAIITYIDLLKLDEERRMKSMNRSINEGIPIISQPSDPDQKSDTTILAEEKRLEYLTTLEKKALRLKVLIEDLFEVSKAASKTVTLQIVDVDIFHLVKQVALEMSDKFKQANLDLRLNFPEEKMILPLDSQKTYRIYENLFGNIAKYALTGTRVYVNATRTPDVLSITLKNITEQEIAVTPEELTDRFVRGDAARNTEGSGLGLSIAKSFMELQGGKLVIEIDGDLFKAITSWEIL
jgi:signal transduction histidine kinase